jgi:carbon-monoxide dehydrogenase small subunit/xanthine dehydrogenase small subunit
MNGELVVSCLVPFAQAEGAEVTTIEGLGTGHALQHEFMNEAGAQCGICTPGMIMVASTLSVDATLDDIRVALAGNLCRCTGYEAIYRAIQKAREGNSRSFASFRMTSPQSTVILSQAKDLL